MPRYMYFPYIYSWDAENLLLGAIFGALIIIYVDQRSYRIKSRNPIRFLHLFIFYGIGLAMIARLFLALIGVK